MSGSVYDGFCMGFGERKQQVQPSWLLLFYEDVLKVIFTFEPYRRILFTCKPNK